MRPRIGVARFRTSRSRPTSFSACKPRVEIAKLIERPAAMLSRRMSPRRSYSVTRWPRRARKIESSEPTSPAPMTAASGLSGRILLQHARTVPHVRESVIERSRGHSHDVGLAEIADYAAGRQLRDQPLRAADSKRKLRTAPLWLT